MTTLLKERHHNVISEIKNHPVECRGGNCRRKIAAMVTANNPSCKWNDV